MMEINNENYYEIPPTEYMSASFFKQLLQNEAAAMASINEGYKLFTDETALLVGNYVHSYFEGEAAHKKYIEDHPQIISSRGASKGQLKSDFVKALSMIKRIEADPTIMNLIERADEHEVIVTGSIEGVAWKGKIDALNVAEGYFIDYKTVKTLKEDGAEWVDAPTGERIRFDNFIEARKYQIQMYVYQTLLEKIYGKKFVPIIVAVSKEEEPIADLYGLSSELLENGHNLIIENQKRFVELLNGTKSPISVPDHSRYYNANYRVHEVKML